MKLFREISLDNGLVVRCFDESRHYFGEYHQVKVVLTIDMDTGTISPDPCCHADETHDRIGFRTSFERMGVRGDDVRRVTDELVDDFLQNVHPYLSSRGFPEKMLSAGKADILSRRRTQNRSPFG